MSSAYGVRVTSGDGQGGSSGWTIGDSRHHGSNGTTWTTNALCFRVNATTDTAAPTVRTATVWGTSLTLTFTESLAAAANLANGRSP